MTPILVEVLAQLDFNRRNKSRSPDRDACIAAKCARQKLRDTAEVGLIHDNPVRAGLVYEPWQYPYSSALDYYGERTGMRPLKLLIGLLFSTAGQETCSLLS